MACMWTPPSSVCSQKPPWLASLAAQMPSTVLPLGYVARTRSPADTCPVMGHPAGPAGTSPSVSAADALTPPSSASAYSDLNAGTVRPASGSRAVPASSPAGTAHEPVLRDSPTCSFSSSGEWIHPCRWWGGPFAGRMHVHQAGAAVVGGEARWTVTGSGHRDGYCGGVGMLAGLKCDCSPVIIISTPWWSWVAPS